MLRHLDIHDILIIDRLELTLQPGLNVLTGETGAGKSILLDALGFVLGWRGRAELVRGGADMGEVTAEFDLDADHPAHAILAEAGLPASESLLLRRVNTRDGRKTAWVNDRRVSGEILRALSDTLVELHGQHDDRGLLNPRGHRRLLDDFGGLTDQLAEAKDAWRALSAARTALTEREAEIAALTEEEDYLRHAVGELEALSPEAGEDERLDIARRRMQAADKVREGVARAQAALGPDGADALLRDAARWLEDAADEVGDLLDGPLEALGRAMTELGEAEDGVSRALASLDVDPGELERTEERLFALRALARKHAVSPDALSEVAETLGARLAALDAGATDLKTLTAAVASAERRYDTAADALHEARVAAGRALDSRMAEELAPLKMERAVFATVIEPSEPGPEGRDTVTFTVATNPGTPGGPLDKIASGGELSRFLLALKVCLTDEAQGLTMIFDEIDRGVGGATADAVGRRLEALSKGAQVLVVTHSPQVAARGGHHWQVAKRVEQGQTLSEVTPLDAEARVDEIARMLSGDRTTDAARDAARTLLAG